MISSARLPKDSIEVVWPLELVSVTPVGPPLLGALWSQFPHVSGKGRLRSALTFFGGKVGVSHCATWEENSAEPWMVGATKQGTPYFLRQLEDVVPTDGGSPHPLVSWEPLRKLPNAERPVMRLRQIPTGEFGGGEGNRTLGPLHAKQVLSR